MIKAIMFPGEINQKILHLLTGPAALTVVTINQMQVVV